MPTRRAMKKKAPAKKPPAKKPPPKGKKPERVAPAPAPSKKTKAGQPSADGTTLYDVVEGLMRSFATSNRITRFLLENLHDDTWHAAPPTGRGRSIASIVCHMHNTRVMWLQSYGRGR